MNIVLRIQRFNPEITGEPYVVDYPIEANLSDRLLDSLMYVKSYVDGSLAFRKSCAHGICGSDAMVINDVERLACRTLIKDVTVDNNVIKIQPLKSMNLERDLIVDYSQFYQKYKNVKPFFINNDFTGKNEMLQSPLERLRFDDATKCILCAACFSACPVRNEKNLRFIGPAAIIQAARFVFDSRDTGFSERLEILDHADGVWACENKYICTKVCPRGIKVTKNINATRDRINEYKASHI
jgi:succinate dehydrogenase / fumarate reductase iron-sulfur subunit